MGPNGSPQWRKWLPAAWIVLAAAILGADYFFGHLISVSILFIVPVALAARLNGRWWGLALAILMPLAHFGCSLIWRTRVPFADLAINAGIRVAVLTAFAVLIDRITRQGRELRVLHGLLPVCSFCKKIRAEDQHWQPMESYIAEHSEASFTHTFCPECAKEHYGAYLAREVRPEAVGPAPAKVMPPRQAAPAPAPP